MTEPKSPWDRDEVTQPSTIITEEQVLGSEANKMDAITHPLRDENTPPYGTKIPPEIHRAVRRTKQDTATGGVASLHITEIAARERAHAASRANAEVSDTQRSSEFGEGAGIIRRPTEPRNPTVPPPVPDAGMLRKK